MLKRKLGYSLLILFVFGIAFASQVTNVLALTKYSETDSVTYTPYGSSSTCTIWVRVSIWAGPKTGGGVYMNHQLFEATIDVDDAYGIWYEVTYIVQGVVKKDIHYEPANKVWNPETWYDDATNYYDYKTSYIVVYAYILVVCRWESSGHVQYQLSAEAEVSYEGYM